MTQIIQYITSAGGKERNHLSVLRGKMCAKLLKMQELNYPSQFSMTELRKS